MNNHLPAITMHNAGEYGLVVDFGALISPEINRLARQLTRLLQQSQTPGLLEVIPAYCTVMVNFDPLLISRREVSLLITETLTRISHQETADPALRVIRVPVCYGGVLGPDLDFVARYTGLPVADVIATHTARPYLVYMLGFTPGFPYLGGMPERIAVPRLEKPRARIPEGSVGIGGNQTGFYPVESSGEWRIIGRTPIKAFNPQNRHPFLFSAGDYLHFSAISLDEYFCIRREVSNGTYQAEIEHMNEGDLA